ncbi:hypothetical protein B0T14DRAFT_514405 [Immersiella caudata]|uniref:Uncharacterized protein n=1 Tax=Immersiella caudata TaxID=314043 RepID=A0AA39WWC8_9PEZI|nr:hypothetical protein B0T14DRAFT_514405 [Immersiella caudata]
MAGAVLYNRSPMTTGVAPPLRMRQFSSFGNDTITTSSTSSPPANLIANCRAFNGFDACSSSGDFGSCLSTKGPDCSCSAGLGYLDCVSESIARSSCWGVAGVMPSTEWDAYERSWYQTACPTPPAPVMSALPQPTKVNVELEPVSIAPPPPTFTTTPLPPVTQPTFTGAGKLLEQAECKSTSFSLVSADNIIMYAAVVGCMADRPQCCPWSVSVDGSPTGGAPQQGNRVAGGPGRFPIPASGVQAYLDRCPDDYYSVSGQCCPNGFYKFTAKIAYQTPCFSSLSEKITPPVLTAGLARNPTDTSLPTSAVINVAWAMGYNVSAEATPPLSKGAAIGVGVGAGVFAIALVALTIWVFFRVRRNKRNAAVPPAEPVQHSYHDREPKVTPSTAGETYPQGYAAAPVVSPTVSPQSTGTAGAGQYGHVRQFSDGSQAEGYGHARTFSDASVSSGGWTKPSQGGQEYGYQGQGGYPMHEYQQPQPGYPQQGYQQQGYQQQRPLPQELPEGQGGYGGHYGGR